MTRPEFGKGGVLRRIVCAGLQVVALLAAGGAWAGDPECPTSLVNPNESVIPIRPDLCRELGFVAGTADLSASSAPAIVGIQQQWSAANANRKLVTLAVRADPRLNRAQAESQARLRANKLRSALVDSGIPATDVFVCPSPSQAKAMALSCPPVATSRQKPPPVENRSAPAVAR